MWIENPTNLFFGSSYFAINGILPLAAVLLSPFMCLCIAIIALIVAVTLWCVDSAATLKCNESWKLGWQGTWRKAVYIGRENLVSECTG